uniref:RNA-binding protein pno-1 n=1 Tax=Haemonchus contortus TaxID=6289 RepID=A0A7I4Y703_HAECO
MADDLPMESIDDMPELIDVDLPAQLPSLIEQNTIEPAKDAEEFRIVSKRKRRSTTKDVEMEECGSTMATEENGNSEEASPRRTKRSKGEKGEMRKIPVPKHRYTPLKDNWVNIFTPIVKNLGLQIRFNMKTRNVEIRNPENKEDTTDLQKAADFVRAFVLGFDVADALALIRLDHLFLETFEVADVKSSLKGDNLSRAIGRIAGKDGRTKLVIENVTKTRIVLADTRIHLLGAFQNLKLARNAISSLILGAPPSKVYGNLRNLASRSSERL